MRYSCCMALICLDEAGTCMLQPLPKAKEATSVRDSGGEPYGKGKVGGGKGKGKRGGKASRMPSDLVGCRSHAISGSPICYGYNLKMHRRSEIWTMQQRISYLCSATLWQTSSGSGLPKFWISQEILTIPCRSLSWNSARREDL